MVLFPAVIKRIPSAKRLITNPLTVLFPAVIVKPLTKSEILLPSISINGVFVYPG